MDKERFIFLKILAILVPLFSFCKINAQDSLIYKGPENCIYQYIAKDIDGKEFDFACLEGQKILIVNTGSKCMFRKQLAELQELYLKYQSKGFVVVVFPCNDFYGREPKENQHIKKTYKEKYSITFPIMSKIHVKGNNIDPVYDFLSFKIKNGTSDVPPKWNFHKYLIDRQGFLYKSVNPATSPLDKEITEWLENE